MLADARGVAVKPFEALGDEVANKFDVPNTELRITLLEDPCANCKIVLPRLPKIKKILRYVAREKTVEGLHARIRDNVKRHVE
jgi:hypothetical protein